MAPCMHLLALATNLDATTVIQQLQRAFQCCDSMWMLGAVAGTIGDYLWYHISEAGRHLRFSSSQTALPNSIVHTQLGMSH